jgi:aspartyl-tRNA(Asn)/glutamyl-tRNA(Gln) amidotransferase subunit A
MDKIGPMCRTAEDCDAVLRAISGHDPQDAGSLPDVSARYTGDTATPNPRLGTHLRLGWMVNQWKEISPDVNAPVMAARKVLESNRALSVKDISLPDGPWEPAAATIVSVEGAAAFRDLIHSGKVAELSDPAGKVGGYINEEISATDFMTAQRIRRVIQKKMDELFSHVDVLVAASLPVVASRLDANLDNELSFADPIGGIGNICGLPAISVPCGFGAYGLPAGLQFIGRPLADAKVIQAARLFQSATDWHTKHPKL